MSSILKGITINESLQDDFIDLMKSKGYNVKPRGSIEQQKAERDAMLAQRKKDAENRTAPPTPSAEEITNAKEKLAQLERVFDKNYQYSDDHSVYSKNQDIAQQISSLRQLIAHGEQGVAEGLGKDIKRAVQGWGGAQDKPADIVKRNKSYDTDTAKKLRAHLDDAPDHTPAGLQKRVLDRKLKGVAEGKGKRCMQCGMINCKCPGDSCKCKPIKGWVPGKGFKKAVDESANAAQQAAIAINMKKHHQKPKNEDMDEGILGFLTKKPQSKLVRRDDYADRLEIARRQRGLSNPYFKILLDKFNAGDKLTDNEKRDLGRWLATQPKNFRAKQELDKYLEVSEATSNELVDLESAYRRATEITKQIKYDDTVTQIIVQIHMLAEKSGIPEENLRYEIDQVYEAKSQLESAIYGLDEVFQDAMRQQQYDQEDNDVDESQIFAGGGMGQSYRKFTPKSAGTMNEMPDTSGPVGTQPGGRRVYRPKSAGTNMKRESSILKGLRETGSTGTSAGSAGIGGGAMVGGPTTYEQEFDPFKRKGARRITAMTNEGKK